jgi:hypothetical protein
MLFSIIWYCKGKEPWVYFYVHNIIEFILSFETTLVFNFINNKNILLI